MTQEKYHIGQVLFVVLNKRSTIYPVQIVEEITKKTISGIETSYIVTTGTNVEVGGSIVEDNKQLKKLDLKVLQKEGEIFESEDSVREALEERSRKAITNMVLKALNLSEEWFDLKQQKVNVPSAHHQDNTKEEKVKNTRIENIGKVMLDDGVIANIKLPDSIR